MDLWTFVPDTSIAVFEPVNLRQLLVGEENRKIVKNLKSLSEFQSVAEEFNRLDSIGLKIDASGELFSKTRVLISFHRSNKSSLALTNLYLVEVEKLTHHSFFSEIVAWMESAGFKKSERLYQGYTINEFKKGETTLAYIFYNNFLIASFSPFLVDDAIRMLEKDRANDFVKDDDMQLAMQQKLVGEGRLYISNQQLARMTARLLEDQSMNLSSLQWFSKLMHLDVSIENEKIDLSGFSILDTAETNYLSAYKGIRGLGFDMKSVIPDHASLVLHVSFDDPRKWQEGLKAYWRVHKPEYLSEIGELENKYGFDREAFYSLVDHEVGLFFLGTKRSFVREKILCIKQSDHILSEKVMQDLAKSVSSDDEVSDDVFAGRRIGLIKIEEIPARLFGEMFKGFSEAYFFVDRNYIFLANSQHALHVLIDDIDAESTWQKSIKTNRFLEN